MLLLLTLAAVVAIPLGLDLYMPVPEENLLTVEKIELGRRLFSDRRLSRDGSIACASCPDPDRAFSDDRAVAVGVFGRIGRRSAPALINRGYGRAFFWDGRIPTLEEQVLKPIQDPKEMDLTLEEASSRVNLDPTTISRALASYVRSILSGDSPFDRFVNGDRGALSSEQQAGLQIFRGKANCTACHVGPTFTDERFHNTGVAWRRAEDKDIRGEASASERAGERGPQRGSRVGVPAGAPAPLDEEWAGPAGRFQDLGRFAVTRRDVDRGAFKTPTLREIARTAPYMHDGSVHTLEDVVVFYDGGGRPNPSLDPEIHPLHLTTGEKQALVVFLRSLSGTIREGVR